MKNYTHITLLVDRSGSMAAIKDDAQGGINEFIDAHKKADGKCTLSLYEFDDKFETAYGPGNIALIENYRLNPRGNTALLDSQMRAINETGTYLRNLPETERPDKVIFITVTDGQENSSHEYRGPTGYATVKSKVKSQEDNYAWEFVYIGANQDAFAVGQSMGISRTMGYGMTAGSVKSMYGNMTASTLNARSTGADTSAIMASIVNDDGTLTFGTENTDNTQSTTGEQ